MKLAEIPAMIARELGVRPQQTAAVIELLDGGNTVPFIARYRKEATGNLDEEQIRSIEERMQYLRNVGKRQEEIRSAIEAQGKLTEELAAAIESAQKLQELEDLYLPFRPKKRTRAQIAREKGLEPLAERMLAQADPPAADRLAIAAGFINAETGVEDAEAALSGARDIVAETIAERADLRTLLRREIWKTAALSTTLAVPDNEAPEFLNYKEYREAVNHMPSHRILAVNRGETKKALKVHFEIPQENLTELIFRAVFISPSLWQADISEAVQDSCKRLLFPAMERGSQSPDRKCRKTGHSSIRAQSAPTPADAATGRAHGIGAGPRLSDRLQGSHRQPPGQRPGYRRLLSDAQRRPARGRRQTDAGAHPPPQSNSGRDRQWHRLV